MNTIEQEAHEFCTELIKNNPGKVWGDLLIETYKAALEKRLKPQGPVEEGNSIVVNLMDNVHYRPFCGAMNCYNPRTEYRTSDGQFICPNCKWVSQFPETFLQAYRTKHNLPMPLYASPVEVKPKPAPDELVEQMETAIDKNMFDTDLLANAALSQAAQACAALAQAEVQREAAKAGELIATLEAIVRASEGEMATWNDCPVRINHTAKQAIALYQQPKA